MTKPSTYYSQGYTCAEAIIKSYNEEFNTDIPVSLGSGMGQGSTVGSLCGAINASIVVAGYLRGRNNTEEANGARQCSKEIMKKVKDKYSTELCAGLKKNKVSCAEIMDFSYEVLKEVLNK